MKTLLAALAFAFVLAGSAQAAQYNTPSASGLPAWAQDSFNGAG